MGRDLRQEALAYLLEKADKQGYVTFEDIMDCADANSLPTQDFDWLSTVSYKYHHVFTLLSVILMT